MRTVGMIILIATGLLGILFRIQKWPGGEVLIAIGFLGFPILYGYITWPVNRKIPDGKWFGTIAMMLLFGLIILFK